jgi:hypothetical protein
VELLHQLKVHLHQACQIVRYPIHWRWLSHLHQVNSPDKSWTHFSKMLVSEYLNYLIAVGHIIIPTSVICLSKLCVQYFYCLYHTFWNYLQVFSLKIHLL